MFWIAIFTVNNIPTTVQTLIFVARATVVRALVTHPIDASFRLVLDYKTSKAAFIRTHHEIIGVYFFDLYYRDTFQVSQHFVRSGRDLFSSGDRELRGEVKRWQPGITRRSANTRRKGVTARQRPTPRTN